MKNKFYNKKQSQSQNRSKRTNATNKTKSGKPDKAKGMGSHVFNIGKSEYYTKVKEFIMSHIRQEYELGNDIATAIEDGQDMDLNGLMPVTGTPDAPRPKELPTRC